MRHPFVLGCCCDKRKDKWTASDDWDYLWIWIKRKATTRGVTQLLSLLSIHPSIQHSNIISDPPPSEFVFIAMLLIKRFNSRCGGDSDPFDSSQSNGFYVFVIL